MCHLYVPEDEVTCQRFDFPLILSGHDHHVVDSLINKTRLLKAGADAEHAIVIDLVWESHETKDPAITYEIIKVKTYEPDVKLQERVTRAYSILDPLKHTQLCQIPREFRPLSSKGSRDRLCSVGRFLWRYFDDYFPLLPTLFKASLTR